MLTHTVEDALRAILYVATRQGRSVNVAQIARQVRASPTYLAKILSQLVTAGILQSTRGRKGGFRLSASAETISLSQVAAVFHAAESRRCLLGKGICGQVSGCAAHDRWAPVARSIDGFFDCTMVSDLLRNSPTLS